MSITGSATASPTYVLMQCPPDQTPASASLQPSPAGDSAARAHHAAAPPRLLSSCDVQKILAASHHARQDDRAVAIGLAAATFCGLLAGGGIAAYGIIQYLRDRRAAAAISASKPAATGLASIHRPAPAPCGGHACGHIHAHARPHSGR